MWSTKLERNWKENKKKKEILKRLYINKYIQINNQSTEWKYIE